MTEDEIEAAKNVLDGNYEAKLLDAVEYEALKTAARYGVTVALNYRNRRPRLWPRYRPADRLWPTCLVVVE